MKTLFEAASMVVLLAISQFTFLPAPSTSSSHSTVTQTSSAESSPSATTHSGQMVKPMSL